MKQPPQSDDVPTIFWSDPELSWRERIFNAILVFGNQCKSSRFMQIACFCALSGIASSSYGVYRLVSDSHLVCQEGSLISSSQVARDQDISTQDTHVLDDLGEESQDTLDKQRVPEGEDKSMITVDVSGAVKNPGVYTIAHSSRLGDVIAQAGGISTSANAREIAQIMNLASKVTDGEKIYVPFEGEALHTIVSRQEQSDSAISISQSSDTSSNETHEKKSTETVTEFLGDPVETYTQVSINTATAKELMELKGIGEKRAADIVAGRPYDSIEDLLNRDILTKILYTELEAQIKL